MLKVLLVDDEPFILQGLKLLVDWENEGFRVAGTAANGFFEEGKGRSGYCRY